MADAAKEAPLPGEEPSGAEPVEPSSVDLFAQGADPAAKQPARTGNVVQPDLKNQGADMSFIEQAYCRGHERPDILKEIATGLQSSLLQSISEKMQERLVGGMIGGMCDKASAHLAEIGSVVDCSNHVGYYSTAQIVANLLHLVVQIAAFPKPVCVAETEVQTAPKAQMVDQRIQCELKQGAAFEPVDAQVQTETDIAEVETQTFVETVDMITQTVRKEQDVAMQTDEKEMQDSGTQAKPMTRDRNLQACAETAEMEIQTTADSKCQCCRTNPSDVHHCTECLNFLMAPESNQLMLNKLQPPTEHVEVQVGASTTEVALQVGVATQEEEVQVKIPDWCEQCGENPVETYHCEDCLDACHAPTTMMVATRSLKPGLGPADSPKSKSKNAIASARNSALQPLFGDQSRAVSDRFFTDKGRMSFMNDTSTCDAGLQVSVATENGGCQATATMANAGLQAVTLTRTCEMQSDEIMCQRCNEKPVSFQTCSACSDDGGKVSKTRGRLRGVTGMLAVQRTGSTKAMSRSASRNAFEPDEEPQDGQGDLPLAAALSLKTGNGFLCIECKVEEAVVEGGRCKDCVSYRSPDRHGSREHSPDCQRTQGVRIGGGFDVLHVGADRGRMAAAREAAKETVRAESINRMSPAFDGSPWQYVHGAPSSFSSPNRFHVGMLVEKPGQPVAERDKLPPAGKKRTAATDADALVRASLSALNRSAPSKTMGGEPYLYRVMAPSTRRRDSASPRPPRELSTPVGNAFMP